MLAVSKINIGPSTDIAQDLNSQFGFLDNEKPFPKVNSVPSLIPLFFQGHVTIM